MDGAAASEQGRVATSSLACSTFSGSRSGPIAVDQRALWRPQVPVSVVHDTPGCPPSARPVLAGSIISHPAQAPTKGIIAPVCQPAVQAQRPLAGSTTVAVNPGARIC